MSRADFIALLPLLILALGALVLTLVVAFYRRPRWALLAAVIPLIASVLALPVAATATPHWAAPLLIIDRYALFYMGLILVAALAVALLAYGYWRGWVEQQEEFYLLLLLATLGAAVLVASYHFASLFLGLELLSVSLFALLAYPRRSRPSLEAGVKYLILSGTSSALLLLGMALIYAEMGTLEFGRLSVLLSRGDASPDILFLAGLAFIIGGLAFKLSWVPFHLWTPDVYQGAPAPVTAFIATVSKGAVFALLLRLFIQVEGGGYPALTTLLSLIALATILAGNLLALLQTNVKRILAYSSIAHLGYLLVALLASGAVGVEAATFYWVAYFVTTLGAFGVVTVLSSAAQEKQNLEDYRGLFWHRPALAGIFTFMLLSLAGIPLTVGFIGKFYLFAAGVGTALWLLVFALLIGSIIGLFYYLRIIIALYRLPATDRETAYPSTLPLTGTLTLAFLALLLIAWGVYPDPLMRFVQNVAMSLI